MKLPLQSIAILALVFNALFFGPIGFCVEKSGEVQLEIVGVNGDCGDKRLQVHDHGGLETHAVDTVELGIDCVGCTDFSADSNYISRIETIETEVLSVALNFLEPFPNALNGLVVTGFHEELQNIRSSTSQYIHTQVRLLI